MSYNPTTWSTGDVITSQKLNKIEGELVSLNTNKVDRENGKGLSTEDYTSAEKTKLSGIEAGANRTELDTTLQSTTKPPQAKVVGDRLASMSSEIEDLAGSIGADITELVGVTPYTLTKNAEITLSNSSSGQTTYTLTGLVVGNYKNNGGFNAVNMLITEGDGEISFMCTGESWDACYVDYTINGLVTGATYPLTVTSPLRRGTTGGYFRVRDTTGEYLATLNVSQSPDTVEFVATTESVTVRLYPVFSFYWDTYNIRTAIIYDFSITADVTNTFTGEVDLGYLYAGVAIGSNPTSDVYVTREANAADSELDLTSERPVQNKVITRTLGSLGELLTTDKTSLVSAINEASNRGWITGTYLGNTPVTMTKSQQVRLDSATYTNYSIQGSVIASYEDNDGITMTNVTLSQTGDKMVFTATGDSWDRCYVDISASGLTVGNTYNIAVSAALASGTTGGYFYVYDSSDTALVRFDVNGDTVSHSFTATTTNIKIRMYPVANYYWETYNLRTASIYSIEIKGTQAGYFMGSMALGVISSGLTITSSPPCAVYALELSSSQQTSRLDGKNCVFFGDSVSAFQFPPNDIPSIVGQITGMNVVNGAFGGCRITDTFDYTQDGYGAFSFVRLVDAILSNDWTIQDNGISDLTGYETAYNPQDHLDALKDVNWNNVDYVVVHWAGNDPGNVPFDDPNNEFNTNYYVGAWRYCIRNLLQTYPQLKIMYVNCTYHEWPSLNENTDTREYVIDGETHHYVDWADSIIEENKKLSIPSLDLYRTSGLNKYNIGYYMTSDMTHPNITGNRMMASKIASRLMAEF